MQTTTIARLKATLSQMLAAVKAGEEVVVTDRGTPIARIMPYRSPEADLDDLVREGQIRASTGDLPADFWTQQRPGDPDGRLLAALLEERETGR